MWWEAFLGAMIPGVLAVLAAVAAYIRASAAAKSSLAAVASAQAAVKAAEAARILAQLADGKIEENTALTRKTAEAVAQVQRAVAASQAGIKQNLQAQTEELKGLREDLREDLDKGKG